jgi:tetratricopeptide (TPR) repeat protein
MYKRALEVDPQHANNITNYASFLSDVRKNDEAAEAMYKRALEANPKHANARVNLAGLLLAAGKPSGITGLHQAIELFSQNSHPTAEIECAFYLFAHCTPPERLDALRTVRKLLEAGARSPNWDFSRNIERARLDGHPEVDWLGKLASVINDEAQPEVLDGWPAWENAAA